MAGTPTRGKSLARKRAHFHRLTVAAVRRLTEDAIEVTFAVPSELASQFNYEPGQYLAIRSQLNGRELRRSYSICTKPALGEIRIAIKRDLGGAFSTWANEALVVGHQFDVMSPQGTFTTDIHPELSRSYGAIAAGSGITPIMALASSILAGSPSSRFTLVYSNRTALDMMFLEELADLKDKYPARLAIHHVLSREQRTSELLSGRIDAEKLTALLAGLLRPHSVDEWLICGPFELVQLCRDTLAAEGVDSRRIHFELFNADRPDRPKSDTGRPIVVDPGAMQHRITFTLDGRTASVNTPVHGRETVLNAALRVRQDVPFACAGGVCGTCRATLVSGTVEMEENYALEPEEVAAGYVLTCQARPTSEAIVVNYDS